MNGTGRPSPRRPPSCTATHPVAGTPTGSKPAGMGCPRPAGLRRRDGMVRSSDPAHISYRNNNGILPRPIPTTAQPCYSYVVFVLIQIHSSSRSVPRRQGVRQPRHSCPPQAPFRRPRTRRTGWGRTAQHCRRSVVGAENPLPPRQISVVPPMAGREVSRRNLIPAGITIARAATGIVCPTSGRDAPQARKSKRADSTPLSHPARPPQRRPDRGPDRRQQGQRHERPQPAGRVDRLDPRRHARQANR